MDPTPVDWRPFAPSTFEEAATTDRPVLLSLTAPWCRRCHRMDREVYADPDLAAQLSEGFVPVRSDADRRPRVRDRYAMGGLPSTVLLTPTGDLLTGAGYLGPDGFRSVVDRVGQLWREKGADAGRVPRSVRSPPPAGDLDGGIEGSFLDRLRDAFDPDYGGWGSGAKLPHPEAIEFALGREPDLATRTLDPIRQHLTDTYDGGFFRYAGRRDWSDPHREKLTGENAALLRAFAAAHLRTGDEAYRETAADAVTYLTTTLWTGEGFAGSQAPAAPEYYHRSPSDRESVDDPPVDATVFADRSARAAEALLTYFAYTGEEPARRYAERALDHLAADLIDDGVVAHYGEDGAPRGLLIDHARVVRAFATAAQVVDPGYAETAVAVADGALSTLRGDHGFVDGPPDGPGLLDRPFHSIDANAALADALVDLHALTDDDRYHDAARHALAAFADAGDRFGPSAAGYATAAARLAGPSRIEVHAPAGSDLHRAALRVPDHEKVVVPDADGPSGTATAVVDGRRTETTTPTELARLLDG